MKKFCLLTFVLLLTLVSTWGQAVLNYNFKVTQEGYTHLSPDAFDIDFSKVDYLAETVFTPDNAILISSDLWLWRHSTWRKEHPSFVRC